MVLAGLAVYATKKVIDCAPAAMDAWKRDVESRVQFSAALSGLAKTIDAGVESEKHTGQVLQRLETILIRVEALLEQRS